MFQENRNNRSHSFWLESEIGKTISSLHFTKFVLLLSIFMNYSTNFPNSKDRKNSKVGFRNENPVVFQCLLCCAHSCAHSRVHAFACINMCTIMCMCKQACICLPKGHVRLLSQYLLIPAFAVCLKTVFYVHLHHQSL